MSVTSVFILFFFNDTATTEIYTLSLHDALPIYYHVGFLSQEFRNAEKANPEINKAIGQEVQKRCGGDEACQLLEGDRKSTRLNSSHGYISYAVFCLKKKNETSAATSCSQCEIRS